MKLLIIGASRGIGFQLLYQALQVGHAVTALVRDPQKMQKQHCCLACAAAKHPILAPNEHLQEMTADAIQRDIDECMRLAKEAGPGAARGKQIAGQTAGGAAVGAASGAVAGAISGGPGLGAAAGAAGGATAGLLSGLLGSSDLDSGQQRYAEDCLRQKGYNPIGWQ